jgi:hypothetical protein
MSTSHQRDKKDKAQDRAVKDSFPASDPPANSGITGSDPSPVASDERPVDAQPTGTPSSDRHATETAHQWENEE